MSDEKKDVITFGVLCFVLIIIQLVTFSYVRPFVEHALVLPTAHIGADPPWYFIHERFTDGIARLIGLALSVAACAVGGIFSKRFAWVAGCISLVSNGGGIAESAVIYFRCGHIFDAATAVSAWPTFDAFIKDRGLHWAHALGSLTGLALIVGQTCVVRLHKSHDKERRS